MLLCNTFTSLADLGAKVSSFLIRLSSLDWGSRNKLFKLVSSIENMNISCPVLRFRIDIISLISRSTSADHEGCYSWMCTSHI